MTVLTISITDQTFDKKSSEVNYLVKVKLIWSRTAARKPVRRMWSDRIKPEQQTQSSRPTPTRQAQAILNERTFPPSAKKDRDMDKLEKFMQNQNAARLFDRIEKPLSRSFESVPEPAPSAAVPAIPPLYDPNRKD
jgi:hypothetical protein